MSEDIKINDINTILDSHIPKLTTMVANGNAEAFLICGDAGIGKTYCVENTLQKYKKDNPQFQYALIGGEISKIGLYKELYIHRNALVVFDDIDSVLASTCANLLKNALNSKKDRVVSYLKNNHELFNSSKLTEAQAYKIHQQSNGKSFPNSFQFNGRCIFISNKPLDQVDEAVKDRCVGTVYLDFSLQQIVDRIIYLMDNLNPQKGYLERNEKYEVLQHLCDSTKRSGKKVTLRMFTNALSYKVSFNENDEWKQMVDLYLA